MALSDCVKCWDTPCTCGWEFRKWSPERMVKLVAYWDSKKTQKLRDLLTDIVESKTKPGAWKEDKSKPE